MIEVRFYDKVKDDLLKFAVIAARSGNKWVFCKHKNRNTYEIPGGHRETGEDIYQTAKRELYEETGAADFSIIPVCVYSVSVNDEADENSAESFGMLYFAKIRSFGKLPQYEMEKVELFEQWPEVWTYPHIQPKLLERAAAFICHP